MEDEELITFKLVKDRSNSDFMIGREIENTPAKGMQTIFLPKMYPVKFIMAVKPQHCTHLYFGANKAFPNTIDGNEWKIWELSIMAFLRQGYWCTLDFQPQHWDLVVNSPLVEYPRFIPLVSLELPNIHVAGYNACVKLDDTNIEGNNGGVWVHSVHNLMTRETYTRWDNYRGDKHHQFQKDGVDAIKRVYKKEELENE
jgi:hypothetical protein